ncbi:hypothetical protein DPSP01_013221 [Paraphaeosphaeria sporulosa]
MDSESLCYLAASQDSQTAAAGLVRRGLAVPQPRPWLDPWLYLQVAIETPARDDGILVEPTGLRAGLAQRSITPRHGGHTAAFPPAPSSRGRQLEFAACRQTLPHLTSSAYAFFSLRVRQKHRETSAFFALQLHILEAPSPSRGGRSGSPLDAAQGIPKRSGAGASVPFLPATF